METMLGGRTVGATRSQPREFWQKQTIFTQSRQAGTSLLAPSAGLEHMGGKEGIFGFLGVRSQGPDYLSSG